MIRWIAYSLTLAIVLITGIVHGMWSGRWDSSEALDRAIARVPEVPLVIGPWQGTEQPPENDAFRQAGADSYWMRIYENKTTRQSVLVILMAGRAGRMSVHTPEVCYRGAGYELLENPKLFDVPGTSPQATFWSGKFRKEGDLGKHLRLFWAWNYSGAWQAPSNPRWEFRGQPFLYKLYISHEQPNPGPALAEDLSVEFLQVFLPELHATLFRESDTAVATVAAEAPK